MYVCMPVCMYVRVSSRMDQHFTSMLLTCIDDGRNRRLRSVIGPECRTYPYGSVPNVSATHTAGTGLYSGDDSHLPYISIF